MSKQNEITLMFDSITKSYDLINRILSFGINKWWRKKLIIESFKFINKEMLNITQKKFPDIEFIQNYATELLFDNDNFDVVSISFGIRNVIETQKAMDKFYRILKRKGILLILEFTKSDKKNKFRNCVDFYTEKLSTIIGGFLSKNQKAYKYLPDSIQNFYTQDELCKMLEKTCFEIKKIKSFNFAQVSMFIAQK